jgi:hypothetical protein
VCGVLASQTWQMQRGEIVAHAGSPVATLLLVLCGDGAKTERAYRAPSKLLAEPEYLSRKPGCG